MVSEIFLFTAIGLLSAIFSVLWRRPRFLLARVSFFAGRVELLQESLRQVHIELARYKATDDLIDARCPPGESVARARLRSQFGEDIVLLQFFGSNSVGYYVEAGGYDGLTFSATAVLESIGWSGMLVEPHPGLFLQCQRNRPRSRVVQAALGAHGEQGQVSFTCVDFGEQGSPLSFRSAYADAGHLDRCLSEDGKLQEIQVDVVSLDGLLDGVTAQVDLLVLDIEGHELNVLKGFSLRTFRPRVLMIEIHFGSDDDELRSYLGTQGYASAGIIGCNELFATESEVQRLTKLVRAFRAGELQGC